MEGVLFKMVLSKYHSCAYTTNLNICFSFKKHFFFLIRGIKEHLFIHCTVELISL